MVTSPSKGSAISRRRLCTPSQVSVCLQIRNEIPCPVPSQATEMAAWSQPIDVFVRSANSLTANILCVTMKYGRSRGIRRGRARQATVKTMSVERVSIERYTTPNFGVYHIQLSMCASVRTTGQSSKKEKLYNKNSRMNFSKPPGKLNKARLDVAQSTRRALGIRTGGCFDEDGRLSRFGESVWNSVRVARISAPKRVDRWCRIVDRLCCQLLLGWKWWKVTP